MRKVRMLLVTAVLLLLLVATSVMQLPSPEHVEDAWERSARLRHRIQEVCHALNMSSSVTDFQLSNILVDEDRKTLYCSVPKVASTTMKKIFLRLRGAINNDQLHNFKNRDAIHTHFALEMLYHPKYRDTRDEMLKTFKKLLIVRSPLERVVSTYRDKVERYSGKERVNFPEYLASKLRQKFGLSGTTEEVSTFGNFVRLIVSQREDESFIMDPHWRSIHETCNPCAIDYNMVAKFEHLKEDSTSVLRWLGADSIINAFPNARWANAAGDVSRQYFARLDSALRTSFLSKYLLDYLSFEYDFL